MRASSVADAANTLRLVRASHPWQTLVYSRVSTRRRLPSSDADDQGPDRGLRRVRPPAPPRDPLVAGYETKEVDMTSTDMVVAE
jgi:hypothetical protein